MIILGIDPGASGAVCSLNTPYAINSHREVEWIKLDSTEKDIESFLGAVRLGPIRPHAYLERVHSMPKQGVASSFKFGVSYGFLRGLLVGMGIPFEEVTPQRWQKAMGCMSKGDKNVTKARAQQLFPEIKITHAIADAILIAEYGRRLRNGELHKN